METVKKIDVHIHTSMWPGAQIQPGAILASPEEIKQSYAELGVEKGFLLPLISPEHCFCVQTNEEMEYVANQHADTFYWFCNVDPRMGKNHPSTDFAYFLNDYKARGALGVGEVTANIYTDDPLMENLFYYCGECNMPVTIHIAQKKYGLYGIIDDLGLPRLEKMLKKYPKLKVLGHSQCFWSEFSGDVTEETRGGFPNGKVTEGTVTRLMRECPNLYCDFSANSGFNALSRDPEFSYRFIEEFSDRIMFGTDICGPGQKTYLSAWLDKSYAEGCISRENYVKFCRGNAIRLFNLNLAAE